jgi:diguanylate cyclase (GGDEF)-like protein
LEIDADDQTIKVTASLGVCWADRGKLPAMDELFKTADAYLYEAKRSGRNRCVVRECTTAAIAS